MRIHKLFIELIEISYRVWAIIFGIAFINSIRIRIYNVHEKDGGLFTFVMVFGVASLITRYCSTFHYSQSYLHCEQLFVFFQSIYFDLVALVLQLLRKQH